MADASLDLAYKRSEAENTPVALQIVQDCLSIAKQTASGPDARQADAYDRRVDEFLRAWENKQVEKEAAIELSTRTAAVGETVTVTGSHFAANETVEIHLHAALVEQVKADGSGRFRADVVVPPDAPRPGFSTTVSARGRSSGKSARSPFRT